MSCVLYIKWLHAKRIFQGNIPAFFTTPKPACSVAYTAEAYITPESNPVGFFLYTSQNGSEISAVSSFKATAFYQRNPVGANHTKNDIGLMYKIENSLSWDCLFKPMNGQEPEFFEESKTFGATYIMIRKPALEIINYLKHANYDNPVNKYVLYGKYGNGVTTTMMHVLHYAHLSQWLIVHAPSVVSWLTRKTERTQSSTREGYIDLPLFGCAWLTHFKNQNLNIIKELDLRLQNNYTWNIREENKSGESLLSLVDQGIARGKYSCDVIIALLDELKQLSKSGKVRTLVAMDNYSVIFHPGRKSSNKKIKYLSPTQVSFLDAFKALTEPDWHNGAAILSCISEKKIRSDIDHFPLNKLSRHGFEFLNPFVPVEVPRLTDAEITSLLAFYRSLKWISVPNVEEELRILSTGNIRTLKRLCAPL